MPKLQESDGTYICDECHETFSAKEIKLVSPAPNIKMVPMFNMVKFVDADDVVMCSPSLPNQEGDRLMACPYCGRVHLFGFDEVKEVV